MDRVGVAKSFSFVLCKIIYQIGKLESYTMLQDCVIDTKLAEYRLAYWDACWAHLFATELK
jgi:hypothetical protein